MRPIYAIVLLLGLTACSHDATRENPLDPDLTAPIMLVSVKDTSGTAHLTWAEYSALAEFQEYRVLRQELDRVTVDTLAVLANSEQTTWVDSTVAPFTSYVYRVLVLNTAGLISESSEQRIRPLDPPALRIEDLRFDAASASATLAWGRYLGPDFAFYRVSRSTGGNTGLLAEIGSIDSTTLRDEGLRGGIEYDYAVSVVTIGGIEVPGDAVAGAFHEIEQQWPIETRGRNAAVDQVRLRARDGILDVLLVDPVNVHLATYDPNGQLMSERRLLRRAQEYEEARLVATVLQPSGTRRLMVGSGSRIGTMPFDALGNPTQSTAELALTEHHGPVEPWLAARLQLQTR